MTDYHKRLPRNLRPYLSAVSQSSVTISGPPRALHSLVELYALKARKIEIYAPYHAPHLNTPDDVRQALGDLRNAKTKKLRTRMPVLSASGGSHIRLHKFPELLRRATEEVLCRQVRWDLTCSLLAHALVNDEEVTACRIFPIASNAAAMLCSSLQSSTSLEARISDEFDVSIQLDSEKQGRFQDSKIAIVGFSGRYPEAASNDELWELLKEARDCHRTIPEDRFDWKAHHDPAGKQKNRSRVKFGCFINDPGVFDARFFNLSPREAENTDPAQRLAIMAAYEAIEMAGMVPDRTPSTQRDRVGVFMGVTSDDWREVNSGQDIDTYFIPGGNRAFVPGRISFFFRFSGPSISVDTACSSSFSAISTACSYLWQGDCDSAVAGGTNVLTNPDNFVGLDRGHFLSTTGNCNPFDNSASGYCRADAVGAVVLKRLEDAISDNDEIFGVIAGASTNHCGQTVSITRPHEGDQLSLFRRILRQTDTNPSSVGYVEMHGTGTQAGDAAEMRSVLSAFAPPGSARPLPLHLGAIKANVGHAESASGVTALIKVLMMMKHSEIPPHRLNGELNRNYPTDMSARNVHIAFKSTPWRREDAANGTRKAFLNNFSAAGGNTALLLEDAPAREMQHQTDPRPSHALPVVVSAKTAKALTANIHALGNYLRRNPNVSQPSLSYTTTARRSHFRFRSIVTGEDSAAILAALSHQAILEPKAIPPQTPKIAFVFTGQGTLYSAMGKQLFDHHITFRSDLLRFQGIAVSQGFPSFLHLVNRTESRDLDQDVLDPTVTHLALTCVAMALSRLWKAWIGAPSAVAAHSLGEYAALYAAGVLSASDTIFLVGTRSRLLSHYCTKSTHSMLAVNAAPSATAAAMSNTRCTVACINSPESHVLSGLKADILSLSDALKALGMSSTLLNVPFAFHSAQIDPILQDFAKAASSVEFHKPAIPYISPLVEAVVTDMGVLNASYLVRAARESVNFSGAIEAALEADRIDQSTLWVDIGSHPACTTMLKQCIGQNIVAAPSLRKGSDAWKVIGPSLQALYQAGADIRWDEYQRSFCASHSLLQLPNYKWDLKNYWIQYRNNFCLTKGDVPPVERQPSNPVFEMISSSVHQIIEQISADDVSTLITQSDLLKPILAPIVTGHKVNSAMLCPSSLYADMALTIAKHMLIATGAPSERAGFDCKKMTVKRPLVVSPSAISQLLRVSATASWVDLSVSMSFYSVDANGRTLMEHAACTVSITTQQNWLAEWKRSAYFVATRVSMLRSAVDSGKAHKLKRGLAYKLFGAIVDYSAEYRGMEQVVLDSESLEATAQVKFQVGAEGFERNPCWIDSLGHIAGFIMNGNDHVCSKDQVFINHGWETMRCAKPLNPKSVYTTYNRMQLESGTMYSGDTYIFEQDELVAIFGGVTFQGVNRSVLDHLLPDKAKPAQPVIQTAKVPTTTRCEPKAKASRPGQPSIRSDLPSKRPATKATSIKKIIAEEIQLSVDEMDVSASLVDLGIDSLLSLTIGSRLRDELDIEVSTSVFAECDNIQNLIAQIADEKFAPFSSDASDSRSVSDTPESDGSELDSSTSMSSVDNSDTESKDVPGNTMELVRKVIAQETGVAKQDLTSSTSLSELGIDSLLSLNLVGEISEQLGTRIPSSFFADNDTLADVQAGLQRLGLIKEMPKSKRSTTSKNVRQSAASVGKSNQASTARHGPLTVSGGATSPRAVGTIAPAADKDAFLTTPPNATSVLLQGSSKTATRALFLLPDGAGSATSYAYLPDISVDIAVYGLNCPWLKQPQDLKCSLEHYVAKFLVEVRRRQPHGPYHFGGASAGGILAYEAAQQLAKVGEQVSRLVLLDSPDPVGLENPNQRMYDFLDSMGMFGMVGNTAPSWLRPHFDAFLKLLDAYQVQPFGGKTPPQTHIIYARDGMCNHESDPRPEIRPDDPREMLWLINNRTDFSGAGWNQLLGAENLHITALDNVNHYTILQQGPQIVKVSALIAQALE